MSEFYRQELERIEAELVEVTLRLDELLEDVRDVLRDEPDNREVVLFQREGIVISEKQPLFALEISEAAHFSELQIEMDFTLPEWVDPAPLLWIFDDRWVDTFSYFVTARGGLVFNPRIGKEREEPFDWKIPFDVGRHHISHIVYPSHHDVAVDDFERETKHDASHIAIDNALTLWIGCRPGGREKPPIGMVVHSIEVVGVK